jgi:hypothetical protein
MNECIVCGEIVEEVLICDNCGHEGCENCPCDCKEIEENCE